MRDGREGALQSGGDRKSRRRDVTAVLPRSAIAPVAKPATAVLRPMRGGGAAETADQPGDIRCRRRRGAAGGDAAGQAARADPRLSQGQRRLVDPGTVRRHRRIALDGAPRPRPAGRARLSGAHPRRRHAAAPAARDLRGRALGQCRAAPCREGRDRPRGGAQAQSRRQRDLREQLDGDGGGPGRRRPRPALDRRHQQPADRAVRRRRAALAHHHAGERCARARMLWSGSRARASSRKSMPTSASPVPGR